MQSYNLNEGILKMTMHKKSHLNTGYILTLGSVRKYHAGDTIFIPEMAQFKDIDVAIVPNGTGNTAMSLEQAAKAVNTIKPAIAIAMHYEFKK